MDRNMNRKSQLLNTCGSAALALGSLAWATVAQAQAIQATPLVTMGTVSIDSISVPNQDTITVTGLDAVIDWQPVEDGSGNALDFLPSTGTVIFQSDPGAQTFAVVNRIAPAANGNVTVIDGAVVSQLQQFSGAPTVGGHVLFYSSTGLLIGPNATFNVGSLVLTTLAPRIIPVSINPAENSFADFVAGTGPLLLIGVPNDTSTINVASLADIRAVSTGSYFVVAAPQIDFAGTSYVNGSTVFAAGQEVTLRHTSGLFDITIPVGTDFGTPISHSGTSGGPASLGGSDNQVIYGVASGRFDPFANLFSGNLGFDPAINATTENGVVVLTANYNVTGTQVVNDFTQFAPTSTSDGEIIINRATITSDVIAHASDFAEVSASGNSVTRIDGDLFLYASQISQVAGFDGGTIEITGNATVSANNSGASIPFANNAADLNGTGGHALISADPGSTVTINRNAIVTAVGVQGVDSGNLSAGTATGGTAEVKATSGAIRVDGTLTVNASANPLSSALALNSGGDATGGDASLLASGATGTLVVGGSVSMLAQATAMNLTGPGNSLPVGVGQGGTLQVTATGSGTVDITGGLTMNGDAQGSFAAGQAGGAAIGGQLGILATTSGTVKLTGAVMAQANAIGGASTTAQGGLGTGGLVDVRLDGGTLDMPLGDVTLSAAGTGGAGLTGGDATAGTVQLTMLNAALLNARSVTGSSSAIGGAGSSGNGGQAIGFNTDTGIGGITLDISGASQFTSARDILLTSTATGGSSATANGGAAVAGSVQMTVDGSRATSTAGLLQLRVDATGGNALGITGGSAGNTSAGTSRLTIKAGSVVTIGDLQVLVRQFGGNAAGGEGGDALGGSVFVTVQDAGSILTVGALGQPAIRTEAVGGTTTGGDGIGGTAQGGQVNVTVSDGAVMTLGPISGTGPTGPVRPEIVSAATGGRSNVTSGTGGAASAGVAAVNLSNNALLEGGQILVGTLTQGGNGFGIDTAGGNALGGVTTISLTVGSTLNSGLEAFNTIVGGAATGQAAGGNVLLSSAVTGASRLNVLADASTLDLSGQSLIYRNATGGANAGTGTGGDVQAADVTLTVRNGATLLFNEAGSQLQVTNTATGGAGHTGGGDAVSGRADVQFQNSQATGLTLSVKSLAVGGDNAGAPPFGDATSGAALVRFGTGSVGNITTLAMDATATAGGDGTAVGGTAQLVVENASSALTLGTFNINADAQAPTNGTAGIFQIDALTTGVLTVGTLSASAVDLANGDRENLTSRIQALDAGVNVLTVANVRSAGNINLDASGAGSIRGGSGPTALNADISVTANGIITLSSISGTLPTIQANTLGLSSADLVINAGSLVRANQLFLDATGTVAAAVLGGTTQGGGYTLTQAEFDLLRAGSLFFDGVVTANTANFDVEVRDLNLSGTLSAGGFGSVTIGTSGSLQVSGGLRYQSLGPTDNLSINAGGRLEILLPTGSISLFDQNPSIPGLAGTLNLNGRSIFAANGNLLGLIRSNPAAPGLAALLTDNAAFTTDGAFIYADRAVINAADYLLTQNTGVGATFSGIIVGPGGLRILRDLDFGAGTMRVVTFAGRKNLDGTFTTNDVFFGLVDYGTSTPAVSYTADSTLNNCNIVLNQCGAPPPPPPPPPPPVVRTPINSEVYVAPPVNVSDIQVTEQLVDDVSFGMEFPQLLDPPPVGNQGLISDPVTSGGDSANSGANAGADAGADDANEDDQNGQ